MPFVSTRAQLVLSDQDKTWLSHISQSRSEAAARVHRAQILLRYSQGDTISAIAAALSTNRPKVERCIAKALQLGVRAALQDLPGRGRRARISDEDKTWVVHVACQAMRRSYGRPGCWPSTSGNIVESWATRV
jgi:hypothetical protein